MNSIIPSIFKLLKQNTNMIDFEKDVLQYMYQLIYDNVSEVFEQLNQQLTLE